MNDFSGKDWKKIIGSHIQSKESLQFYVSPDIPKKIFSNCIKSYAKYVTSKGDRILALYDGGRSGKEGFVLTEQGISYNDSYGNFGGTPYDFIQSYDLEKGGDPGHPFPIINIGIKDGSSIKISFLENPQAAPILISLLEIILKENQADHTATQSDLPQTLSLEEKWVRIIQNYLPHKSSEGLYKSPYIPEHLVLNAIASYAINIDQEKIIALFEYKTQGFEGFILTNNSLIYNMGYENWGTLYYKVIIEIEYVTQKLLNNNVPTLHIKTSDGRYLELQFIIHPQIAQYLFDVFEKGILINRTDEYTKNFPKTHNMEEMIQQYLPHDPANRIYKYPEIPEKLLESVRTEWPLQLSHPDEHIYAFYDNSARGIGESGCILTDKALYIKNSRKNIERIFFHDLQSFTRDSGRHHNNIKFVSSDGMTVDVSFYLFSRAQHGFLHFLRNIFPDRETRELISPGDYEQQTKKFIYTSKKTISEFIPKEISILLCLCALLFLRGGDISVPHFLAAMVFFFFLLLLGLFLLSFKSDYSKINKRISKMPIVLIKDAHIKEREPIKIAGKAVSGIYTLDNGRLYREQVSEKESLTGIMGKSILRSKKEIIFQVVPFYLEDSTGKILILAQDSIIGLYERNRTEILPGDILYACGILIKNPIIKDFPQADFALAKSRNIRDLPLSISDNEKKLGSIAYDSSSAYIELISGWFLFIMGIIGEILLFFEKSIYGQRGIELILDLFR